MLKLLGNCSKPLLGVHLFFVFYHRWSYSFHRETNPPAHSPTRLSAHWDALRRPGLTRPYEPNSWRDLERDTDTGWTSSTSQKCEGVTQQPPRPLHTDTHTYRQRCFPPATGHEGSAGLLRARPEQWWIVIQRTGGEGGGGGSNIVKYILIRSAQPCHLHSPSGSVPWLNKQFYSCTLAQDRGRGNRDVAWKQRR